MDDDDLLQATAIPIYRWDCPHCGEENEIPHGRDYGDEECESCGETVKVVEG